MTFGHHLLAYVEMFERDRERLLDARRRINRLPLGAAALAGTTFPIDRAFVAQRLGFGSGNLNSARAPWRKSSPKSAMSCRSGSDRMGLGSLWKTMWTALSGNDREVMVQVLINLIENAVKFGKSASRREISVLVRCEGDRVVMRVSDTGPGIPRHALKKIFDDFYRVDNDLTRTTKGTGIGLALVKRFVEAMGGHVSAANNDGPGFTITFTLPGAGC